MRITQVNTIKAEIELSQDDVILIVLSWLEKQEKEKRKVDMEKLSVLDMRHLAKTFVLEYGLQAVRALDPKLLLRKQDLLVACKGKFALA